MRRQRLILRVLVAFMSIIYSAVARAGEKETAQFEKEFQKWREDWLYSLKNNFGQLSFYRKANMALKKGSRHKQRVVFFGDSITQGWDLAGYFPGKPYINRGISSQTTSQMLLRFRQDVIQLRPAAVVILAGTNDLNGNTGPMSIENIEANLQAMAEAARVHNIAVIFASILPPPHEESPVSRYQLMKHPPSSIEKLNAWLKAYSLKHGASYLDYGRALRGRDGHIKPRFSEDGIHPNPVGYKAMAPLAQAEIARSLSRVKSKATRSRQLASLYRKANSHRPSRTRLPHSEGIAASNICRGNRGVYQLSRTGLRAQKRLALRR